MHPSEHYSKYDSVIKFSYQDVMSDAVQNIVCVD